MLGPNPGLVKLRVARAPAGMAASGFQLSAGVPTSPCRALAPRAPEYEHQHAPGVVAPRKVRLRPNVVRADAAVIKTPIKAKARATVARVDAPVSKHPTKPKAPGDHRPCPGASSRQYVAA